MLLAAGAVAEMASTPEELHLEEQHLSGSSRSAPQRFHLVLHRYLSWESKGLLQAAAEDESLSCIGRACEEGVSATDWHAAPTHTFAHAKPGGMMAHHDAISRCRRCKALGWMQEMQGSWMRCWRCPGKQLSEVGDAPRALPAC